MAKATASYSGGTLRSLLFHYSSDRSCIDPKFKAEFDAAQAEERRLRAIRRAEQAAKEKKVDNVGN